MGKGSRRKNKPKFGPEVNANEEFNKSDIRAHLTQNNVSVSLRYFSEACECFSDWEKPELKLFSSCLKKINGYTRSMLQAKKNMCEMHKGPPRRARFSRPSEIGEDVNFWEIKVDQSNKLRMHGPFIEGVFFLVWLDREHDCFPS